MNNITLYRTDPALNMRRYYRLDMQRDLFGAWCVVYEWGRIGRAGRMQIAAYPSPAEAEAAIKRQRLVKERRGYSGGASDDQSIVAK
jgi:predicted DNA-binding WGR domain protein